MGQGYVGLTAALGLAEQGHRVTGVESDPARLAALEDRRIPFDEPGMDGLLDRLLAGGGLRFAATLATAGPGPDAVVVAVGSPPTPTGRPDLRHVHAALAQVAALDPAPSLVMVKSTVPPGTSATWLAGARGAPLRDRYVYSPEFLNQGAALEDWRHPARLVAGLSGPGPLPLVRELYRGVEAPWVVTDPTSAEVIKYAGNAFLATKVSFAADLVTLCEGTGADIDAVLTGTGLDPRIGPAFLRAEAGYAGSCLPKDTRALAHWARLTGHHLPVVDAVATSHQTQLLRPVRILTEHLGAARLLAGETTVAVLGLRYQTWTDDLRDAPCQTLLPELAASGARLRVWEPSLTPERITALFPVAEVAPGPDRALAGAAAALVLTDWPELLGADWSALARLMRPPRLLVDTKNCLPPAALTATGLVYRSMGPRRPAAGTGPG
ncbi:nucleotide sugar dehydrogenase [Streptomyces caatingaensis]|uniref:nucleotide sugar dehydrogenase n=1 Tax=Streptomyces caatingaensis TaxID=1678637 RepID=UPI0006727B34|nr:nucleotide sugar dehydrogenase [Streptomyces caatingaensis]